MEFWVEVPEQPDNAVAETISSEDQQPSVPQQAGLAESDPKRLSARELIQLGESRMVEFKSSARWNLHRGDKDPAVEREIIKAVAGFMNAHGGTLLIGVNDSHEPIGLQNDYKLTKKGDRDPRDSFENGLTDLCDNTLGNPALANVSVSFEAVSLVALAVVATLLLQATTAGYVARRLGLIESTESSGPATSAPRMG